MGLSIALMSGYSVSDIRSSGQSPKGWWGVFFNLSALILGFVVLRTRRQMSTSFSAFAPGFYHKVQVVSIKIQEQEYR